MIKIEIVKKKAERMKERKRKNSGMRDRQNRKGRRAKK